MKLNLKRKQILNFLRKDARITFSEIGKKNNYPVTTVFDNYNILIDKNIIKKHVSILDFELLGFSHRFIFLFKVNDLDFLLKLKNNECLNSLIELNNNFFLADCIFSKSIDADNFYEQEILKNCFDVEKFNFISWIKLEETFFC